MFPAAELAPRDQRFGHLGQPPAVEPAQRLASGQRRPHAAARAEHHVVPAATRHPERAGSAIRTHADTLPLPGLTYGRRAHPRKDLRPTERQHDRRGSARASALQLDIKTVRRAGPGPARRTPPARRPTCATSRATSTGPSGRCANGAATSPRPNACPTIEDLVGAEDLATLMDARHTSRPPAGNSEAWPSRRPATRAGNHLVRAALALLLPDECAGEMCVVSVPVLQPPLTINRSRSRSRSSCMVPRAAQVRPDPWEIREARSGWQPPPPSSGTLERRAAACYPVKAENAPVQTNTRCW